MGEVLPRFGLQEGGNITTDGAIADLTVTLFLGGLRVAGFVGAGLSAAFLVRLDAGPGLAFEALTGLGRLALAAGTFFLTAAALVTDPDLPAFVVFFAFPALLRLGGCGAPVFVEGAFFLTTAILLINDAWGGMEEVFALLAEPPLVDFGRPGLTGGVFTLTTAALFINDAG